MVPMSARYGDNEHAKYGSAKCVVGCKLVVVCAHFDAVPMYGTNKPAKYVAPTSGAKIWR